MKKIFLLGSIALSIISCADLDDNISSNMPLDSDVNPTLKLNAAEVRTYSAQVGLMTRLSSIWTNTYAGNYYYFANPMVIEYSLNINSSTGQSIWNDNYRAIGALQAIIDGNGAKQSAPVHVAISQILKANYMHYLVDFYGDVPYSEAFKFSNNLSPKYDKGEAVYMGLINELDEGLATINNTISLIDGGKPLPPIPDAGQDVIFGKDYKESDQGRAQLIKWKQFANTVKLRMLVRMSNVTDATVAAFRNTELDKLKTLEKADFISYDVAINPGYSNASSANLNPLYREYGRYDYTDTAFNTNGWRINKASDYYAKFVNGESTLTLGAKDARGTQQFAPVGGKVVGILQGGDKPVNTSESQYSFIGWKLNTTAAASGSIDGYVMLGSEALLLLAEAKVLYPSTFVNLNASSLYDDAILSSFNFYNVGTSYSTYMTNISTKPGLGWNVTTNKLEAIQNQRLVSLAIIRPVETYLNYLKYNYPNIPLALTAEQSRKPYRLVYPASEYSANSSNVPNMSTADCFTKNALTPFWLRN